MGRAATVRAGATALGLLVALGVLLLGAPPAMASCASDAPVASAHQFTGTVVETELGGRVAFVRTDDGRDVVVRGTDATSDNAMTSVDRDYLVGHRYLFHPVNDESPYSDNICTATADVGLAATSVRVGSAPDLSLAGDVDDSDAWRAWALGAAAGVGLLVTGVVLARKSRLPTAEQDDATS